MPNATSDVNPAESRTAKETEQAPSSRGNGSSNDSSVDDRGVSWENRAKEYERKYNDVSEKLESYEERLAELDEKVRLTESEKAEKAKLESKRTDLESLIEELESKQEAKPWLAAADKRAQRAKLEAVELAKHEIYVEQMEDFISETAEAEGMDAKKFRKELLSFAGKYADRNPLQRAKSAYKDLLKQRDLDKRERALKEKEAAAQGGLEGDGRAPREMSLQDAKAKGDKLSEMRALGL